MLAAANVTPARPLYYLARAVIALTRAVPDLVWALLFVTAVGLGPFPGALALSVHSIGMLGRLFSEVIEDMDFGPVEALTLTGASRLQVFTHAVVPGVLPSLLGISLYRFDENLRSSLVLGFVGAGGLGFQSADRDEPLPVSDRVAAADRHLRPGDGGRARLGAAAPPGRLRPLPASLCGAERRYHRRIKSEAPAMRIKAAMLKAMGAKPPYAASRPLEVVEVDLDGPGRGEVAGQDRGGRPLPFRSVGDRRLAAAADADGPRP